MAGKENNFFRFEVQKLKRALRKLDEQEDGTTEAVVTALLQKLEKGTFTGTAEDLRALAEAVNSGFSGKSITPSSTPDGTGVRSWIATQAGPYPNHGGFTVEANSFAVISRDANGAFSISQTALGITSKADLVIGKNLFNLNDTDFARGFYLNAIGGTASSSSWSVTHYIPVKSGQTVTCNKNAGSPYYNCFYNVNKVFVSGSNSFSNTMTATVDGFVRFTVKITSTYNASNAFIQVELGSVFTNYMDYQIAVPNSQTNIKEKAVSLEYQELSEDQKKIVKNNILAADYDSSVSYTLAGTPSSTITGKYIHSSGNLSSASYNVLVYNLANIDRFRLQGTQNGDSVMNYGFFADEACTTLIQAGTVNATGTNSYDIIIPKSRGAVFLGLTKKNGYFVFMYLPENLLSKTKLSLDTSMADIVDKGSVYSTKLISSLTIADKYIHSLGGLNTDTGYKVYSYNIDGLKKIKVQGGQFTGNYVAFYAFYNDLNCTSVYQVGTFFTSGGGRKISETLTVPSGVKYIGVTVRNTFNVGVFSQKFFTPTNEINCFGDSLTFGAGSTGSGSTGLGYPELLGAFTGLNINNFGIGGENSLGILARQGGVPMKIQNPVTIPSGTTPVSIGTSLKSLLDNSTISPFVQAGKEGINPCTVSGIECTMSLVSGTYYLTRNVSGTARTTTADEIVFTSAMKNNRNALANIFYLGTNVGGWTTNQDLINQYKYAIDFSNSKNYLIIGLHSKSGYNNTTYTSLENDMSIAFGAKYINVRKYLITNALSDAGITPTTADNNAIALGNCPPSLLVDSVHFNDVGYSLLAKLFYNTMVNLGIV